MVLYVHFHVSVSVRAEGAQQDWIQGTRAGAPTEQCQHLVKQTTPPKIHTHCFPDTAEMLSPAHGEIDGVFGLPVAFRGGECVYVI